MLVISYVGYTTQEVKVSEKPLTITLVEDRQLLDEVIVIGYGTTTRKSAVSAVDQVKKDMLENRPVTDITQALQGAAPNLIIQTREFDPAGQSTNINVRGVSSLNDNTPLIVIDGIVADQTAMDNLSPMDVDNVSVLKDAGSAAIYGSRSASGVILITTKGGQKDSKPKVRLSSSVGWEVPYFFYRPVSAGENAQYRNLANINAGREAAFLMQKLQILQNMVIIGLWTKS